MIDVDKAIAAAVKTGKVSFGTNSAIQNGQSGKAKLIIVASTCPKSTSENIQYYCKLSNVPTVTYRGSALDLGGVCGKSFAVSALSIREAGDSEILKLTEPAEPEDTTGGSE